MDWLIYCFRIDGLARAFRSALKAFENEQASLESDWNAHLAAVAAGQVETVTEDETTGAYFDYGEHVGELLEEVEQGKRHIREAFVTAIYHLWEKKAAELLKLGRYEQSKAFMAAKAAGWTPDEVMIDRLRMTANCIKHDSQQAQHLDAADPSYFDQNEIAHGWYEALALTDAHVEAFIATVKSSGPPMKKWLGTTQEVTL